MSTASANGSQVTPLPNGTANGAPASSDPSPSSAPDLTAVAAQVRELAESLKSFRSEHGKELGKIREKVRREQPEPSDSAPAPVTQADLEGAMLLGEIRGKLGDAGRKAIDELRSQGLSYAQAATVARAMLESSSSAPATGARTAGDPPVPTGAAATAASRTSPAHPRSLSEFVDIRTKDPERFKVLMADPTFHPEDLPSVIPPHMR